MTTHTVGQQHANGRLLAVTKDAEKDRLIFDCAPLNTLESPPNRWFISMVASSNLLDFQLASDERMLLSGTDLREVCCSFSATHERVVRNSLIGIFFAREFETFSAMMRAFKGPALSCLVSKKLAQTAHLGILWTGRL